MSHSVYDLARQLKAPGVQVSASFNPTRLSKSLHNLVRKSILSGYHTGGWASQTKHVRELIFTLAGEMPPVYVTQDGAFMSLHIYREISKSAESEIIGLFEADATLRKMDYDASPVSRYRPSRDEFYNEVDKCCVENTARLKFVHKSKARDLRVTTPELRKQIAAVFLNERCLEDRTIATRLAMMLDKDLEYAVSTTREYF